MSGTSVDVPDLNKLQTALVLVGLAETIQVIATECRKRMSQDQFTRLKTETVGALKNMDVDGLDIREETVAMTTLIKLLSHCLK